LGCLYEKKVKTFKWAAERAEVDRKLALLGDTLPPPPSKEVGKAA